MQSSHPDPEEKEQPKGDLHPRHPAGARIGIHASLAGAIAFLLLIALFVFWIIRQY